jgi:hypothetical protein
VDPHRVAEERSIAMHRAIADKLRERGDLLEAARRRVAAWRARGDVHEAYVAGWERLLALPLDALARAVVDPGEEARALRQVSPFAGALDPRERWRIRKSVA